MLKFIILFNLFAVILFPVNGQVIPAETFTANPRKITLTDTIKSAETVFTLNTIPNTAIVSSASLTYTQENEANGLLQIIDKATATIIESKALSPGGAKESDRFTNTVQKWVQDPSQNLGLFLQIVGVDPETQITLKAIKLSIKYTVPDNQSPELLALRIDETGSDYVVLSWEANEDAVGYIEYGKTSLYGSKTAITSEYSLTGRIRIDKLSPGITYHYKVVITDRTGNINESTDKTFLTTISQKQILGDSLTIVEPNVISPPAAINIELTTASQLTQVAVSWAKSTTTNLSGYIVYRSVGNKSNFSEYRRVGADINTIVDSEIETGTTYFYFVRAYKENTASKQTTEKGIMVPDNASANAAGSTRKDISDYAYKVLIIIALISVIMSILYLFSKSINKLLNKKESKKRHGLVNVLHDPEYYTADIESTHVGKESEFN